GIMKSVGYQSKSVLSQVLFENALLGGVGGLSAIALVALATTLLGKLAFKTSLDVAAPLAIAIILASSLLAAVVSGLVAWAPTRVRPREGLGYEGSPASVRRLRSGRLRSSRCTRLIGGTGGTDGNGSLRYRPTATSGSTEHTGYRIRLPRRGCGTGQRCGP